IQNGRSLNELNRGQNGLETYRLFSNLTHDFLPISGGTASDSDSNPRSFKMSTRESLPRTKCDSYLNQSLTNVPSILSHFSSSNASVFDRIVSCWRKVAKYELLELRQDRSNFLIFRQQS